MNMMHGNDGVWDLGEQRHSNSILKLTLGSPNVGSTLGVNNVFIKAVGHDFTRIASRETLWIPTIEIRDFQTMHEPHCEKFTAKSLSR